MARPVTYLVIGVAAGFALLGSLWLASQMPYPDIPARERVPVQIKRLLGSYWWTLPLVVGLLGLAVGASIRR